MKLKGKKNEIILKEMAPFYHVVSMKLETFEASWRAKWPTSFSITVIAGVRAIIVEEVSNAMEEVFCCCKRSISSVSWLEEMLN